MTHFIAPIRYVTDVKAQDPLVAVTQAMSQLLPGERIFYTLIVLRFANNAYKEGHERITVKDRSRRGLWGVLRPIERQRYVRETQRVFQTRLQQYLYQCLLIIQLDALNYERLGVLMVVDNQTVNFGTEQFNSLHWIDDHPQQHFVDIATPQIDVATSALGLYTTFAIPKPSPEMQKLRKAMRLVLEPKEIATLWHLPHQGFSAPTITWSRPQVRLPNDAGGKREGICLGINEYAGRNELVYMPLKDRSGHISVIGKAGVGKSTFLHQLIHQDIMQNRGVAVIDPHGTLVRDILRVSIPPTRDKDVVVLDLANEAYPPPMNLLTVPVGIARGNAASLVMAVVKKFYEGFEGRMADTLWAALITIMEDDTPTVRDVSRLFRDPTYRARLVAKLKNIMAEDFWADFEQQSDGQQEQMSYPVKQRMRAFYGSEVLYPVMCHPQSLNFASLIAQNKILLISLKADESRVPESEQRLLGSALMSQLQLAIMGRKTVPSTFYLYVDEAQYFVTTPLNTILSESRKFGLSLVLANQYLKQLVGDTLDAVMGNIGAMVVFQCGLEDARAIAPYMAPGFDAEALINLDKYEAAVKMRFADRTQPAFSLSLRDPLLPEGSLTNALTRENYLRQLSIKNYTPKSRAEVLAWLEHRYPRPTTSSKQGHLGVVDFDET